MRVFYGIVLDPETKNRLYDIEEQIKKVTTKGRFVPKENFHITLKFLGEIDAKEVKEYGHLLEESVSEFDSFVLKADKIGAFVKKNRTIVWVGLSTNHTLVNMNKNIQDQLIGKYGLSYETFTPHITLGREVLAEHDLCKIEIPPFDIKVKEIALFESTRINGKLVYQEKALITLNN